MPTVSLKLKADSVKVLKIKEAFEFKYGPKQDEETDIEFMERHIKEMVKKFAILQHGLKASSASEEDFEDPFEDPEPPPE